MPLPIEVQRRTEHVRVKYEFPARKPNTYSIEISCLTEFLSHCTFVIRRRAIPLWSDSADVFLWHQTNSAVIQHNFTSQRWKASEENRHLSTPNDIIRQTYDKSIRSDIETNRRNHAKLALLC